MVTRLVRLFRFLTLRVTMAQIAYPRICPLFTVVFTISNFLLQPRAYRLNRPLKAKHGFKPRRGRQTIQTPAALLRTKKSPGSIHPGLDFFIFIIFCQTTVITRDRRRSFRDGTPPSSPPRWGDLYPKGPLSRRSYPSRP